MAGSWKRRLGAGMICLTCAVVQGAPPPATTEAGKGSGAAVSPVKTLLAEEANGTASERELHRQEWGSDLQSNRWLARHQRPERHLSHFIVDAETTSREHVQTDDGVHTVKEGKVSDAGRDSLGAQRTETDAWQHRCPIAALLPKGHDFAFMDV